MVKQLGPMFGDEVIAAGLGGLPFSWGASDDTILGRENLTIAQNTTLDGVVAAHDPTKRPTRVIDLATLQARIDQEGAWDTYVNYMFGTPVRRNAFLKTVFKGRPLEFNDTALLASLAGAGIAQAAIDRIVA